MDQTQNYLNSILKKRLGSVVNYNASTKTPSNVSRIPKQQQKIQSMPTVFRKKHQTVYHHSNQSHYSQPQSQYFSMKQATKIPITNQGFQMPQQNKQSSNQRVQYMLISKRIQSKKQDQFISPTVDVTNYNKGKRVQQIKHPLKNQQNQYKSNIYTGSERQQQFIQHKQYYSQKPRKVQPINQMHKYDQALSSKISVNTDKSKRKRIFQQ